MKEKSKNLQELFVDLYPAEACINSPMTCAEAIGYLRCLKQFVPSEKWITTAEELLILTTLKNILKEGS